VRFRPVPGGHLATEGDDLRGGSERAGAS
jgi:hypothetical protein